MTALAARLETIQRLAGINAREVADLVGASPAAVSRWRRGRMPEQERLRVVLDLDWLVQQLADLYDPDEARLWLFARHPLLRGQRPFDRIKQGKIDDVLALIDQLRSGAVV